MKIPGVAFVPSLSVIDHLAVIAHILDIPLLIDELPIFNIAKKYYPTIESILIEDQSKILEFTAKNFDILFFSSSNYAQDLAPLFEHLFRKKMLFWFCPHGNSDKTLAPFKNQTHAFLYGKQMEERLSNEGLLQTLTSYTLTGNYRYLYYKQNKPFLDALVEKEVFSRFSTKQKTLLYAPTHQELQPLEATTSSLITSLPDDHNLIIKFHPWTLHFHSKFIQSIPNKPNLLILKEFPLIYPLLNRTDIYLGDTSSIGYDYLPFDRPMFFSEKTSTSPLSKCGESSLNNIFSFNPLEHHHLFYPHKTTLYSETFERNCCFELIKESTASRAHKAIKTNHLKHS